MQYVDLTCASIAATLHQVGHHKVGLAKAFLDFGLTQVVLSDCDSVWRHDALAYTAQHGHGADILVASNHLTPLGGLADVGLELPGAAMGPFDTGELEAWLETDSARLLDELWGDWCSVLCGCHVKLSRIMGRHPGG